MYLSSIFLNFTDTVIIISNRCIIGCSLSYLENYFYWMHNSKTGIRSSHKYKYKYKYKYTEILGKLLLLDAQFKSRHLLPTQIHTDAKKLFLAFFLIFHPSYNIFIKKIYICIYLFYLQTFPNILKDYCCHVTASSYLPLCLPPWLSTLIFIGPRSLDRSDLWVKLSVSESQTFVKLYWCDSGWWRYQLNTNW